MRWLCFDTAFYHPFQLIFYRVSSKWDGLVTNVASLNFHLKVDWDAINLNYVTFCSLPDGILYQKLCHAKLQCIHMCGRSEYMSPIEEDYPRRFLATAFAIVPRSCALVFENMLIHWMKLSDLRAVHFGPENEKLVFLLTKVRTVLCQPVSNSV